MSGYPPDDVWDAMGEVLAAAIYETDRDRYICRMCDADVTDAAVHEPGCEWLIVRVWMLGRHAALRAALGEGPTPGDNRGDGRRGGR